MGILNVKGSRELVDNLYKEFKTDRLKNIIMKANCRFVYDNLPETSNFLTLNTQLQKHNTRKTSLFWQNVKTTRYGSNSITLKVIKQWNEI